MPFKCCLFMSARSLRLPPPQSYYSLRHGSNVSLHQYLIHHPKPPSIRIWCNPRCSSIHIELGNSHAPSFGLDLLQFKHSNIGLPYVYLCLHFCSLVSAYDTPGCGYGSFCKCNNEFELSSWRLRLGMKLWRRQGFISQGFGKRFYLIYY